MTDAKGGISPGFPKYPPPGRTLTPRDMALLERFSRLSDRDKNLVEWMIQSMMRESGDG